LFGAASLADPKQLPPTLPGSEDRQLAKGDDGSELQGLSRTLFVRLQQIGVPTILLRTQYRYVKSTNSSCACFACVSEAVLGGTVLLTDASLCLVRSSIFFPPQLPPAAEPDPQPALLRGNSSGNAQSVLGRASKADLPHSLLPLVSPLPFIVFVFVCQGVLLNGTTADARFPFLVPQPASGPGPSPPALPPLLFVDVSNGQELSQQGSRSLRNLEEVRAVQQLVVSLLRQGVKPSQIGITSLYRSQVSALREAVSGISVKPIVQQPQDAAPRTPTKRKKGATFSQPPSQDSTAVASGLGIQVSTVDAFQVSFCF